MGAGPVRLPLKRRLLPFDNERWRKLRFSHVAYGNAAWRLVHQSESEYLRTADCKCAAWVMDGWVKGCSFVVIKMALLSNIYHRHYYSST